MKESINKMVVVEMPQSKPVITGGHQELPGAPKMKYKPGDVLNLTCTSAPSNPPAQLEWRLNDKKVCISNAIDYCYIVMSTIKKIVPVSIYIALCVIT